MSKTFTYTLLFFLTLFLCTSNCFAYDEPYYIPEEGIIYLHNYSNDKTNYSTELETEIVDWATNHEYNTNPSCNNNKIFISCFNTYNKLLEEGYFPDYNPAGLGSLRNYNGTIQSFQDTNDLSGFCTGVGGFNPAYFDEGELYCFIGYTCNSSTRTFDIFGYYKFMLTFNPTNIDYISREPVNGACGDADGNIYSYPPDSPLDDFSDWCDTGSTNTGDLTYYGDYWTWNCYGLYGGNDDSCIAYNSEPVDALCGLYEGNYYDDPPTEAEDFCELGTLIFPTFVETTLGWSWSCAGYNGGNNANCVAYKNIGSLPELPEQDDCTLQDIPDRWFCEISNSLKSIFLPDAEKINELQETINRINGRFPFNYLSVARTNIEDINDNTETDTITISLLDNYGDINLDAIEPLAEGTKKTSQGLFLLGFVFWGIGYIKHFFK